MHVRRNYEKASILFISLSVFPLYFVGGCKIPRRKRNPQKKAHKAQSKLQRSRRKKKNVKYEQTKIENEKQQKIE